MNSNEAVVETAAAARADHAYSADASGPTASAARSSGAEPTPAIRRGMRKDGSAAETTVARPASVPGLGSGDIAAVADAPASGVSPGTETSTAEVDAIAEAAAHAAGAWAAMALAARARVLDGIAERLDAHSAELIALAVRETRLAVPRLAGELKRTSFQLRLFAQVVRDGGFLDVRIDSADADWPMGAPRPDLRRMNIPLGPVLNFAASNFPFAFSVAGGDTASALAAGCPVIVKANPGHPELSRAVGALIDQVLDECDAPRGTFGLIFGRDAGVRALRHPAVSAVAFTGSTAGGRALYDLACARPVPIPFYGELGSINPVFVTPEAARVRAAEIAAGLLTAVSSSAGQLCTKPGLVAVPEGAPMLDELRSAAAPPTGELLNDQIAAGFAHAVELVRAHPEVRVLRGHGPDRTTLREGDETDPESPVGAGGQAATSLLSGAGAVAEVPQGDARTDVGLPPGDGGPGVSPPWADANPPLDRGAPGEALLLVTTARAVLADSDGLMREMFGPATLLVTYRDSAELLELARSLHGELTVSVFGEEADDTTRGLFAAAASVAGRVLWNSWPTGLSVTHAQQHGGPYPATTAAGTTSVGTAAITRFLRPVAFQSVPDELLPPTLRAANPLGLPRSVDGARAR